jgi:hemoglobin/transferrin/lactoferrin receptor protein
MWGMATNNCGIPIALLMAALFWAGDATGQEAPADQTRSESTGTTQPEGQASEENSAEGTVDGNAASVSVPPVTVTATRNPLATFEYPGSVSVIDHEEIDTKMPSTPGDILQDVPNVTFTGGPRRTGMTPIIRGFTAQDVILLLDGTRQNLITGHDGRFYLDPALIESAEVVRGASSALYGSGGLGGVIEFRTRDVEDFLEPGERYGTNLFLGGQSVNDEIAPGMTLFARPDDNLDVIGSFVYRNSGDIDTAGPGELDANDEIYSGLAKATYKMGSHRLQAGWLRYDGSAVEPDNGQSATSTDQVRKDLLSQTWRMSYGFSDPDNKWVDLDATVYYTQYQIHQKGITDDDDSVRDVGTKGLRIDNRSRVTLDADSNILFTYGIDTYRDDQDGELNGGDQPGAPDAYTQAFGAFSQAEITLPAPLGLPGDLLVIPGLRFDYWSSDSDTNSSNSDQAVSPKIGVSYLPSDWLMFYGSYAYAFSAPNINDLYLTGVHFTIPGFGTNFFQPNPDLKPQTTRTIEAGMGIQFEDVAFPGDRVSAKGGWFLTYGDDIITRVVDQPAPPACIPPNCNGTTIIDNVDKARLEGVEIESGYENEYMLLEVSYSHIDGENRETGEPLGDLQPDTVSVHAAAKVHPIDTQIGWRVTHGARFDKTNDPAEERDAYLVNDIYALWRPQEDWLRGFSLGIGIDNLFNETYSLVYEGANEPERNYKAQVAYQIAW